MTPTAMPTPCRTGRSANPYSYRRRRVAGRGMAAHRAAWIEAYGPIPDGLFVLHRCDNPPCDNPNHLFLGTAADNHADMVRKGRQRIVRPNPTRSR